MAATERHKSVFSLTHVHAHRLQFAVEELIDYLESSTREARVLVHDHLSREIETTRDRVTDQRLRVLRGLIEGSLVEESVATDLRSRGGML